MKEKEILDLVKRYGHIAVVRTELEDVELDATEKEQVIETTTGQFLDYLSIGDMVVITKSLSVFDHTNARNAVIEFLWHIDNGGHFVDQQFAHFLLVDKPEGFEVITDIDCDEHMIVFKVDNRYFMLERVRYAVIELFGITETKNLKISI